MATYRMEDSTVVKTENAKNHWNEDSYHDGRNFISRATGSQWEHEELYESRKGRFYLVHSSNWQGSHDHAEWISMERAAAWLTLNGHEIPENLKEAADSVTE